MIYETSKKIKPSDVYKSLDRYSIQSLLNNKGLVISAFVPPVYGDSYISTCGHIFSVGNSDPKHLETKGEPRFIVKLGLDVYRAWE